MITRTEIDIFKEYTKSRLKEEDAWAPSQRWKDIWAPFNEVERIWWSRIPPCQLAYKDGKTFIARKDSQSTPGWYVINGYNTEGREYVFSCKWS